MIRINEVHLGVFEDESKLPLKISRILKINPNDIGNIHIVKKSLDARKKPTLFYSYSIDVETELEDKILRKEIKGIMPSPDKTYHFPQGEPTANEPSPVIVGMGPAGLFCGYMLAKHGFCPVIYERGKKVEERTKDVETFWETGKLLLSSNVQFGEGGAGTFSDGKLNTLNKDRFGRNKEVLRIFVENGAPENILYDNKPHLGTDILANIVRNMREKMLSWGAKIYYESTVTDFKITNQCITEIQINESQWIPVKRLVLAIGHSARDTFFQLNTRQIPMEAKSFAVGLRVQHPQEFIDKSQYGMENEEGKLPAASYKLTAQTSEMRSVFSFCMCPGGYVVNASSEDNKLAINGMSYSHRDSGVANSAIIVSVTPEDYPGEDTLAGIAFQRMLEEKAYEIGSGKIPLQYYGDYKASTKECENNSILQNKSNHGKLSFDPMMKGAYAYGNVRAIMPESLNRSFIEGMTQFDRKIPGFADDNCIVAGVESRTSSPVRILRDDNCESAIRGLYPCGEGAGYAGGITSAAMDGICVAEKIALDVFAQ